MSFTFIEKDNAVFLNTKHDFPLYADYLRKAQANRIEIWSLLKQSKHFDEMYKLFGGMTGKNFDEFDLLKIIVRRMVNKLGKSLKDAYPNKFFKVFMSIDRYALHRIEFCEERHDDFDFNRSPKEILGGIEEIVIF